MKKITVAICVDDNGGMLLFGKRLSRDRALIDDLLSSAAGKNVYITPFSKNLFDGREGIAIFDDPISMMGDGDIFFAENISLLSNIDVIAELVVYRWNRRYPSDYKMDIAPEENGFSLCDSYDFVGNSHDKITKDIYRRV